MRQATVEQSTIVYKGTFAQMLPWLPTPGNKGFSTLSKSLSMYGLSPTGMELEAPSSKLNDVVLTMSLLADRVKLRLSYAWFEVIVANLYEGDAPSLIEIANHLFAILREIDAELSQGSAEYRSYAHLKMRPTQADELIKENLGCKASTGLFPDAFAYQMKWEELAEGSRARIVIAKSLQFDDGLFVDLTIDYASPDEPAQMVERLNEDYDRALRLLGLETVPKLD